MTVTPVLAEEATPEAAAPAETVAVDAPTFYANSHDVKAVVMNIGAAQDSVYPGAKIQALFWFTRVQSGSIP